MEAEHFEQDIHLYVHTLKESPIDSESFRSQDIIRIIHIPSTRIASISHKIRLSRQVVSNLGGLHTKLTRVSQTMTRFRGFRGCPVRNSAKTHVPLLGNFKVVPSKVLNFILNDSDK